MKSKKIYTILLVVLIILQVLVNIYVGTKKEYYHMDEAYSYGLMNYDKLNITDNEDFLNKWHNKEYYIDYFALNSDEMSDWGAVYENQKNDVHPPLYYLLLRISSLFTIDSFSKWTGIGLNIIILAISSILMYIICNKIFKSNVWALIITAINAFSFSTLENAIYIRMYALSTLNMLLFTYMTLRIYEKKELNIRDMILTGLVLILGGLTHYYFFIYVVGVYLCLLYKSIRKKNYKFIIRYTIMAAISAGIYLLIFPYSISHIFFGYRGAGSASGTTALEILKSIGIYLYIVNKNIFNYILPLYLIVILGIFIVCKIIKKKNNEEKQKTSIVNYILAGTLLYFVLIAILTPYKELRYILPICPLIIICTVYYSKLLLQKVLNNKATMIIISICFAVIICTPALTKNKLEFTYSQHNGIAERIEKMDAPILYVFNTQNNRFLDDIYLFTLVDESYILNANDFSEEKIDEIFENKDLKNGLVVICNADIDQEELKQTIYNELHLNMEYTQRMNACDIYYAK